MKTVPLCFDTWMGDRRKGYPCAEEPPLRGDLYSPEQLAGHARALAMRHRVVTRKGADRLLARLDHNERILRAFNRSTLAADQTRRVTPAAEWLLDNFYLIEEQIQLARRHLPRGYSRGLPRLVEGPSDGLPRVYDMVLGFIAHVDAQIDAAPLAAFIADYQTVAFLKLGELWAIPIMLRLGLIENLQRITTRLSIARRDRDLADEWVDRLQQMAEQHPSHLVIVVADMAKSELTLTSSFVVEFCQRLSRHSPVLHLARNWLEQRLGEHGQSIEQLVQLESQQQAADQVSVSHSIASLRFLSAMDWRDFVEPLSRVDQILRQDPAGIYGRMDFLTRDRYRHRIEFFARRSLLSEVEVAVNVVRMAEACAEGAGREDRTAHVGYFLIDAGQAELGRSVKVKWPLDAFCERSLLRFPLLFHVGGIGVGTLVAALAVLSRAPELGVTGWQLFPMAAILLVCTSQLAVELMNWLSTQCVKPHPLPRLDFSKGIAPGSRTMVVVPTMLTTLEGIDRLVENLELHHLANRDGLLHFALLTDLQDAESETLPGDAALVQRARDGIRRLNRIHPSEGQDLFFLFHRPRRWNPGEGVWMGFERKRGKLVEFNSLLRGEARDCFSEVVGDLSILSEVRYVITLDTDTQLPREAAGQLVATLAHPLNRARVDERLGIVTEGYAILQPRVRVSLASAGRSWYVRLFAGEAGIDPYTRAVSDVYQDVFREGSFIGKGIYEVDPFRRTTAGRFPDNAILSHDLLEACHARSALVSDIELHEGHPSRYDTDSARRHRWIRGDWQIAQWLLRRVPGPDGVTRVNPLSDLSQWKILDNLRRSLVPGALLCLLLGSWLLTPQVGHRGTWVVLALITLPGLLVAMSNVCRKPDDLPWGMHLQELGRLVGRQMGQVFLTFTFLPYEAFMSLDAIGRTLVRVWVTRKRLLEWRTFADAEGATVGDCARFHRVMWIAPVLAVGTGMALTLMQPGQLMMALPILGLWTAAPWIAWRISRPIEAPLPDLGEEQVWFLRRTARKTWHFFETFVTAEENWLPPDNFQEVPTPVIATRTSPTNMGLALLANLAARDLGYVSMGALIRRTRDALGTMERLERHRGHFYNWYETRTLQVLPPMYVSSVDSGNLAAHLLTLGSGLREMADAPIYMPRIFEGLRDTIRVIQELDRQDTLVAEFDAGLDPIPATGEAARSRLEWLTPLATRIEAAFVGRTDGLKEWSRILREGCESHLEELTSLSRDSSGAGTTLRQLAGVEGAGIAINGGGDVGGGVGARAGERMRILEGLAEQCDAMAAMDFGFVFNPARNLFVIGCNVAECRNDTGYYDLLASEARVLSYVAIALGQVPQDHWFSLGRLLVASRSESILVSWSGSMFEYLMPHLVMPSYERTLLDQTCQAVVRKQIEYGKLHGVPWGISESGYHRTDVHLNYQYRAFGVPGLGLKRGLAADLVIAPYASAMALMVAPRKACQNLQRLALEGREGPYGFYEAVDYTPARMPPGGTSVTIRSYMAHHHGMSLLALVNVLLERPMQRRFMACPLLRATDLLLQERVPNTAGGVLSEDLKLEESRALTGGGEAVMRLFSSHTLPTPEVNLLSNGRYHVVVTSVGGGYSRWRELAVTRWREDATRDNWGTFIYLRDVATGEFWSAADQPTRWAARTYEAIFTEARAEFRQRRAGYDIHTGISVSPEDDVELRRLTITNRSSASRTIEVTTYAEVVLAPAAADAAHPAFSNLFVQTEFVPKASAILVSRRARSMEEKPPWLVHLMVGQGGKQGEATCETDRFRFVGRGGSPANPAAMRGPSSLSNTVGSVLDPIVSLRRTVTLGPNETVILDVVIGMTESREAAVAHMEKYQSPRMADRACDLAWTHGQVTLHHLDVTESEAKLYCRLAGALIYADQARRANAGVLAKNRRGQSGLWGYGISGDAPVVLLRISDGGKIEIVRQLIKAHSYWRMKGLAVELVILNEDVTVYRQSLQDQITSLVASGIEAQMLDKPGGIFVRRLEQVSNDDRVLLQAVARIVLDDERGSLAEQMEHRSILEPTVPLLKASQPLVLDATVPLEARELIFANGLGGFSRDGREYVITLHPGQMTPAPWVNVVANPWFGTVISESGAAYTWVENAHEFRLTPWSNDPVQDPTGEAIYIRDEQTGQYWSPTPQPARGQTPYVIRHGFGYTIFEHTEYGIESELRIYVAMDAPVKFSILKLRNVSGRPRRLSVTGYVEWVLGELRHKTLLHVQTEVDPKTCALLARNVYNTEFAERIAFLDVNESTRTVTGDRKEFIGRNGSLADPAAMKRVRLSGRVGAGLDPCGAVQVQFHLLAGQERETTFRLGVGRNMADVHGLIRRFRRDDAGEVAMGAVHEYWNDTLGAVTVETPDPAVNVMANGWLLYQTLSCRIWGRTGFYQSGGAYGFRDQLQDVMALVHAEPALTREHLLRAAAHQFREGDVQHWWHPPAGRGVRTRISDDFLWLPHVTCRYVMCVGDTGVLDEQVAFVEGRPLQPEEEAYYDLPNRTEESATLYQHCVRAIERGLKFGRHGLPLIGTGDWNDGMDRVGREGRGESVWLAFFLCDVLTKFAEVARSRKDIRFAERCMTQASELKRNIELHTWDGAWYRRAYFDSGEPLGSAGNPECQIDSLPQSWSVISGVGDPWRSRKAMEAVDGRLVRRDAGLIQLFDPPFDKSAMNPGYIKGYIPGVRENGGQYTHGAIWTAMAFAMLGDHDRAWELFNLLNPVGHGSTAERIAVYKVEPYVIAADVYAVAPHVGRGGWSWYTGSAGWMYRLLVETLLGVNREGDQLRLTPRMPGDWTGYQIHYRYRQTPYRIRITRLEAGLEGPDQLLLDGVGLEGQTVPLVDDRREHVVELKVGRTVGLG